MPAKTTIIVVGYNAPEYERNTINAVLAHTPHGSYKLHYLVNDPGRGLASCWNREIIHTGTPYVCLLNPDTVPAIGWLERLEAVLDSNATVGAVVPSSNDAHISRIEAPFGRMIGDWGTINEFAGSLTRGVTYHETLSAMCVLVRVSAFVAVEGFDEDFKLYGEDTELFWRMGRARCRGVPEDTNWRLAWEHGAYVHHYRARCTGQLPPEEYAKLRAKALELCRAKGVPI